jgi:hypothetical protein
MRLMKRHAACLALALVAGCAAPPQAPSPAPGVPPLTPPPPVAEAPPRPGQPPPTVLAAEVRWMAALFDGTPVRVASESDGAMRVEVPMQFSFDANASAPKPPLRAVMDKLSATLARQPGAKVQVAAPGPAARASAMRSYLGTRGVLALRVATLPPPAGELVTLRVVPGPTAIDKLDDRALPPPTGAFPAAKTGKSTAP